MQIPEVMMAVTHSSTLGNALYAMLSKPMYIRRAQRLRRWKIGKLDLVVLPGVFHPRDKKASRFMLKYLKTMDLSGIRFLEIGSGSAILACLAACKGARAHAADIVERACRNAALNSKRNNLNVSVYHSDLFETIPDELRFDLMVCVPPTLPRYPVDDLDFAFCCGEELEFFDALFSDLPAHLLPHGRLLMPVPNDKTGRGILHLARKYGLASTALHRISRWFSPATLYGFAKNHTG